MTNRSLFALVFACVALLAAPHSAHAKTYESYHCHCSLEPKIPVGDEVVTLKASACSCYYDYTLGKSGTREFRGYCDGDMSEGVSVDERDTDTTCTMESMSFGGYVSRSCTNWDPFSTDNVRVRVQCSPNNDAAHDY